MAAYGSLVSLQHILEQIQLHPQPPISLDKNQVESLTNKITFLQKFLEGYSPQFDYGTEADPLETRIADAAYAAEDLIESHIVDRIHAGSTIPDAENVGFFNFCKCFRGPTKAATDREDDDLSPTNFYQKLQKVIEDMDSLNKEVVETKSKTRVQDQLVRNSIPSGSLRSSSLAHNIAMVGFDDVLVDIMDKLTGGRIDLQIIPIVGMGGAGKTTLARNIYQHQVIVQHFYLRAWVTVSQEHRMTKVLLELLEEDSRDGSQMNESELREKLHKKLWGRRYVIIIDDIWDIKLWDQLRSCFPDNKNGSRIVITTRMTNLELNVPYVFQMRFLDEDKSWILFSKIVFGEESWADEWEEIGKKIVGNCRGLPLSIVVVGGLLAKSKHTREYWEYIAENLSSIVNSENDESCLKILHLSYNQLPVYLKPCFLHMGIFPEDKKIRVSELVKLWVAEGFLRPISGKSLEDVAYEYLKELIDRNLVLIHQLGCTGYLKYCKIHDLLRDLCLRQAKTERFYSVVKQHSPEDTSSQRRIVIPEQTSRKDVLIALQGTSPARSLICDSVEILPLRNFRLLRTMSCSHYQYTDFREVMLKLVNSRCLLLNDCGGSVFPSSFYPLWNLHTLIIGIGSNSAPFEIWNMPQLRHLKFGGGFKLPDLPSGNKDAVVLRNLQTLGTVINLMCYEEVVKRIPNIRKLKVRYMRMYDERIRYSYVNNLGLLHKLESLCCSQTPSPSPNVFDSLHKITFPHSLKKLDVSHRTPWRDMLEKIGSLPLLEKLKLKKGFFNGGRWKTLEGQFRSLKFLRIENGDLEHWTTESSHFPRLEHIVLESFVLLKEIPSEIGEITTLKSIELIRCSNSVVVSAGKMVVEREELYGEVNLEVKVFQTME